MSLGFTFYPKDWWTSDSFYILNPFERYLYLEILFMMYANDGFVANNRVMIEARLRTTIREDVWAKITDLLVKDGDQLTHVSVNKRLRISESNRNNGRRGGAPVGNNNAKKTTETTEKTSETTAKTTEKQPNRNRREEKYKLIDIDKPADLSHAKYFYIAKSFHKLFIDVKGSVKSLTNAGYDRWVEIARLLVESDKVPDIQLVAIKLYLEDAHKKVKGTDPFWIETIYSLNALRKKSKDDVYYFDMIGQQVKKWLELSNNDARVRQAHQRLEKLCNGN